MKRNKIFRGIIYLALVALLVNSGMPVIPAQADPDDANFSILPATTTVQQNQLFTVTIQVDASSEPVDGAQAYLNFDRNYLRVVDASGNETNQIINGTLYNATWPDVLTNTADNTTGQINYAAGKGTTGSAASTLFTLATIRFKAIAQIASPGTAITFSTTVPRATRAVRGLNTVTGSLTGSAVIIGAPDANFSLLPVTTTVGEDEIFTMAIKVDASSQPLDGAQAYLNFDKNYLRVVDANGNETNQIINGTLYNATWPDVLTNTADNSTGQINYAAGKGTTGTAASTLFTLATIRFKAIAQIASPGTAITFNTSIPRATRAVRGLNTVTGSLTGSTVIIGAPGADTTPPAAVTNLGTQFVTSSSVTLTWTAPGDDGNTGTATEYDIRYSSVTINTEARWAAATQVAGEPPPQVAGSSEEFQVTGLNPNTTYHFALKTRDEANNWSSLSNAYSTTTLESFGRTIGPGMLLDAISLDNLHQYGNILVSVTVDILVPGGSVFNPASDLASLSTGSTSGVSLYKDNKTEGWGQGWLDPTEPAQDFKDTHLPLASNPTWANPSSGVYRTVLTLATPNTVPSASDVTGPDYFVVVQTSNTPAPGGTFKVQIPANGIVISGATAFTTAFPVVPEVLTVASGGQTGSPVLISEIQTQGATAADEFIELYNRSDNPVDLSNYSVQYISGTEAISTNNPAKKRNLSGVIPTKGFFLITNSSGYDGTTTANVTYTTSLFELSSSGGTVFLVNSQTALTTPSGGTIQDKVAWGMSSGAGVLYPEGTAAIAPTANGSLERKANADSTPSSMASGGVDATIGNGHDTDDNFYDFVMRATAGPQNTSSAAETSEQSGQYPVVINEFFYNGTGQWIEFYNNSVDAVSISGWKIIAAGKTYTFPSANIQGNGFVVVNWNATGANTATSFYTGTTNWTRLRDLAGDIYLTNASDTGQDYVQYGGPGRASESAAAAAGHWASGMFVGGVLFGESLGRGNNGYDSNQVSDWQAFTSPTMGAANTGGDSFAPSPVTNVALSDPDITTWGIDGGDVRVTWTPSPTPDDSFAYYEIYLLPANVTLDTYQHEPFGYAYGPQTTNSWMGFPWQWADSANQALDTGSYKAYVRAVDSAQNKSASIASASATLTSEGIEAAGADTMAPNIMSMPVKVAKAGASTIFVAEVYDDRDVDSVQLKWRVRGGGAFSAITGEEVTGTGIYRLTFPWNAGWSTATQIDYYLVASDASANYRYFTANPGFDMGPENDDADAATLTGAAANAFVMSFAPASSYTRSISGTVYDSTGATISGAYVYIPGIGLDAIQSAANGTYSFTQALLDGTYDLVALKAGYIQSWISGVTVHTGNPSSAGNDFYLTTGSSGGGGDVERPFVVWTEPGDGMIGAPTDINLNTSPIVIHISKRMDSSTIADSNAADAGSNIYLTRTGQDRISGQVTYNETDQYDPKIIFSSSTALSNNTTYMLVISSAVRDTAGNPIQSNQPDGSWSMVFTTFADFQIGGTFLGQAVEFGIGMGYPPYISGAMPSPGAFDVPTNSKITVIFSEAMDPTSIETTDSTGTNVRLYDTNYQDGGSGEYVTVSVSLDQATRQIATITRRIGGQNGLLAANHHYAVRVLGGARSSAGITMVDPNIVGYQQQISYQADLDTGSSADTTRPQVAGLNLEMYRTGSGAISSAGNIIDVPTTFPTIEIGFDKDMDPSTINRNNIILKRGTTEIAGTVEYRPLDRLAKFALDSALSPNTDYTLRVVGGASGVASLTAQRLETDYYAVFTTSSEVDSQPPRISFGTASDYMIALTFSEAMNAARQTNTAKWGSSVLNPANYSLWRVTSPPPHQVSVNIFPYTGNQLSEGANGDLAQAQGITIKYSADTFTATIEGLQFPPQGGFSIWVNDVTDISGNLIDGNVPPPPTAGFSDGYGRNAAGGPVESSQEVGKMMGPGAMGMTGAGGKGIDRGMMGMLPTAVMPMSMLAGTTTTYFVDIPLTSAIPAGGSIVLTFPSGFDVSRAKNADPDGSWVHQDINGPGPGTVVLSTAAESPQSGGLNNDGITVNTQSRTVTITLGAVATQTDDFVHIEIEGIKNTKVPKDFSTAGYTVDIKTMASDRVIETMSNVMPFFIMPGGDYKISGTVTFPVSVTGTMSLFGGSPLTGPIEKEISFANATTANYEITELTPGQYFIMTDPMVTMGGNDYFSSGVPEPIWIINSDVTKNFTFTAPTSALGLTVRIRGDFSGAKASAVDIFASSPSGFSVKTVNLNANYSTTTYSTTLYLPSEGMYWVGIGPAMPKGPMTMGPPPEPKFAPPPGIDVSVTAAGGWTESSDTANDGIVTFTVATANAINGHVLSGPTSPIANAQVYAYSPMGGFGTNASSAKDGSFTLLLPDGVYNAGAFLPGMPPSIETSFDVRTVGGVAKIYVGGVEKTELVITLEKPERTISGKVTDGTNLVAYAPVWTYRTDGPGWADTATDSSGEYILYVTSGTWNVNTYLPGYGELDEKTGIQVTTQDIANQNFAPGAGVSYVTISGNVSIGGEAQPYMPIRAVEVLADGSFTGYGNYGNTDSSGNYTLRVKGTASGTKYYRVDTWTPDYGEVAANSGAGVTHPATPSEPWNVVITTSNVQNVNILFVAGDLKTMTITFSGGTADMEAYVDIVKIDPVTKIPLGMGKFLDLFDLSATTTVSLPAGTYNVFAFIPGYGGFAPTQGDIDLSSNANCTFNLAAIDTATVFGTVRDQSNNAVADAAIHIGNLDTGVSFDTVAGSNGTYTLNVGTGTYFIGAEKKGYIGEPLTVTVVAGNNTQDLTLTQTSLTISGYVYKDNDSDSQYDAGEGIADAFVHAEKLGGGFAGISAAPDGSYELYVSPGDWRLFAVADEFQEKPYSGNPVTVTTQALSNINIRLADTVTLAAPKSSTFKPASGTTFDNPGVGLKLTLPPNAIGTESTDFKVAATQTSKFPSTTKDTVVGGKGQNIAITDSSGKTVNTLKDAITIEIKFTKAELEAVGISSLAVVQKIKISYWDESASAYKSLPTTIAYDPTGVTIWANLVSVTFKASTKHLTVFGATLPKDSLAPSAPTSVVATAGASRVSLTWTAPTTNTDGSALTDLLGYEVYRAAGSATGTYTQINTSDVTTTSYTDTTAVNGTTYYYKVTAADTGGNESAKSSASNAATPAADATNPTLSSSVPADNATSVAADANIVLNFSEAVDAETGNITIKLTSDDSTFETIDVTNTNKVSGSGTTQITINPAGSFASATGYYVLIDATAFDDAAGNSYAGISLKTTLNFTSADVVSPTLSSSVPADNATSVAITANIVLNFSEAVDAETGNITIKLTSDDSTFETIDVTGSKVSGSGTTQITINPAGSFASATGYYVLIDATAFDDAAGNSYAGISLKTTLNFTSADVVSPTLSSSVPADNATSVAITANIVLNFSEAVDAETGNITIKLTSDDSTFETIDVTGSKVSGSGTAQITINPAGTFASATGYYVLIDATAFDDAAGNSYAGISLKTTLNFTSAAGADFSIAPATTSVELNQVFTVDIKVDASSHPVDAAQAYINFDRNYLRVVDASGNETNQIINGALYSSTWPDVLTNLASNTTGQINYAAGKGTTGSAANTLFTLATIRFKAIAQIPSPGTAITFNTTVPRATRAVYGLDTVTSAMTGSTVIISVITPEVVAPAPTAVPPTEVVQLEELAPEEAAAQLEELAPEEAAAQLEELTPENAGAILEEMAPENAGAILEELTPETAGAILEELTPETAGAILEELAPETAGAILEELTPETAGAILEELVSETAGAILEELVSETAGAILEEMASDKAGGALENMAAEKAGPALENVAAEKASAAMEQVATEKLEGIIPNMSEASLTDRLPGLSAEKLFSIQPDVLFSSLPNAPTEQLLGEESPQPPAELSAPTVVSTTPAGARYLAPIALAGEWAAAVGTPMPVDRLLIKAKRALNNIGTTLEVFEQQPAEIAVGLPAGQIVRAYLNIAFENASSEDIALGHITFKVEKEWLSQNSVHKWSLVLSRYDPQTKQWISLPTKRIKETDSYVYYTAVVTHFSTFAIAGSETLPAVNFQLANLRIKPVKANTSQDITISADVTNLADKAGTYVATLWIDSTAEAGMDVGLQPNETKTVSFTVTRDVQGDYEVRLDRLFSSFSVSKALPPTPPPPPPPAPAPAQFVLSALSITPSEVESGETVTISVLVVNRGGVSGSYEIALKVDDVLITSMEITLGGGARQEVNFTTSRDAAGTYKVEVNGLSGTFTVKAPAVVPPQPKPVPWLLIVILAVIVIAGVSAYIFMRRRRG